MAAHDKMHRSLFIFLSAAVLCGAAPARAADDYSPAERALFMSDQLADLRPPAAIHYRFVKRGSLEPGFDDRATLEVRRRADGSCCAARSDFLSGAHRVSLPEVEQAEGNPVLLYFLERDIHEMSRLTHGQANYFRKRIRMAIYQGAHISDITLAYRGHRVAARRITISPYLDDPLRARFEQLATKRYDFILSDAVPGDIVAITTLVAGAGGAAPVLSEQLVLDGAVVPGDP
ncbi:MAG: hypothetical protein KGL18_09280 [Burkholderiales bacterium]|nr:hypothetical protein [Burkholderiales bacterium]MDE2157503.1 hypothetical protein [Burkholderiales bacterium]MDE2503151.1 hypothetical protein [Burkholderiales bacterium]